MKYNFRNATAVRNEIFGDEHNDTTFIATAKGSKNPELTHDASKVLVHVDPIPMRLLNTEDVGDRKLLVDKLDSTLELLVVRCTE